MKASTTVALALTLFAPVLAITDPTAPHHVARSPASDSGSINALLNRISRQIGKAIPVNTIPPELTTNSTLAENSTTSTKTKLQNDKRSDFIDSVENFFEGTPAEAKSLWESADEKVGFKKVTKSSSAGEKVTGKPKEEKRWVWGTSIVQDGSPDASTLGTGNDNMLPGSVEVDTPAVVLSTPTYPATTSSANATVTVAETIATLIAANATSLSAPPVPSTAATFNVSVALEALEEAIKIVQASSFTPVTTPAIAMLTVGRHKIRARGSHHHGEALAKKWMSEDGAVDTPNAALVAPTFAPLPNAPVASPSSSSSSVSSRIIKVSAGKRKVQHQSRNENDEEKRWVWASSIFQDPTTSDAVTVSGGIIKVGATSTSIAANAVNTPTVTLAGPSFPPLSSSSSSKSTSTSSPSSSSSSSSSASSSSSPSSSSSLSHASSSVSSSSSHTSSSSSSSSALQSTTSSIIIEVGGAGPASSSSATSSKTTTTSSTSIKAMTTTAEGKTQAGSKGGKGGAEEKRWVWASTIMQDAATPTSGAAASSDTNSVFRSNIIAPAIAVSLDTPVAELQAPTFPALSASTTAPAAASVQSSSSSSSSSSHAATSSAPAAVKVTAPMGKGQTQNKLSQRGGIMKRIVKRAADKGE